VHEALPGEAMTEQLSIRGAILLLMNARVHVAQSEGYLTEVDKVLCDALEKVASERLTRAANYHIEYRAFSGPGQLETAKAWVTR
jgi:hypothetical protein